MKQLTAGGGVALIGMQLIPLLSGLFSTADHVAGTITTLSCMATSVVTDGVVHAAYAAAPKITEIVSIVPLFMFC